jgi:RsiW-degrading membrane proteinase PrsW (M82 family)
MIATILDWAIALAPVLVLLALFEWLDVFHLIHLGTVAALLLIGAAAALAAYPLSGRFLDAQPMGFSDYSQFVAPWIEEGLKALGVLGLFVANRIGFKLDAAISGFAIGAGFAMVENILYLLQLPDLDLGTWLVRGLGTAVMHGGTTAVLACLSHQLTERAMHSQFPGAHLRLWRFVPGYLAAVALHTGFNRLAGAPGLAMLGSLLLVPLVLLLVFRFGEGEARAWLEEELVSHREALADLKSGSFPDTASGQLVARLARRIEGRAAPELIRRYLELHTELALRAEEMLRHKEDGEPLGIGDAERDLIERMADVRRQMGRTNFATLRPLLPMARSDDWEIHQLEVELHFKPRRRSSAA